MSIRTIVEGEAETLEVSINHPYHGIRSQYMGSQLKLGTLRPNVNDKIEIEMTDIGFIVRLLTK